MSYEVERISFEEAVKRLPVKAFIHTFRRSGLMLLGVDHDREALLGAMKAAEEIHVTDPAARAMKHGLAIRDGNGWLCIETVEQES
jgi:hypothetical protein